MSKAPPKSLIPSERIEGMIYVIRDQKIILDQDLSVLYEVDTGHFNRAIKRNQGRFPEDFAFQLTNEEWLNLKCQIGISRSTWGGRRKLPMAFTEHGVAMAANLLKSKRAISISVEIVRAFIKLREFLSSKKELSKEVTELRSFVLKHAQKSDQEFRKVWQAIEKLSTPLTKEESRIGFDTGQN